MQKIYSRTSILSIAAAGLLAGGAAQAQGQGAGEGQGNAAPVCSAANVAAEEGGKPYLLVSCRGRAVALGRVDSYELVQLPALKSTVAVTQSEGMRRAWLIMDNGEDNLALEEITGTIARLAGRPGKRNLEGIEVDFADINRGQLTAAIRRSGGESAALDLGAMVARSRAAGKQNDMTGVE